MPYGLRAFGDFVCKKKFSESEGNGQIFSGEYEALEKQHALEKHRSNME